MRRPWGDVLALATNSRGGGLSALWWPRAWRGQLDVSEPATPHRSNVERCTLWRTGALAIVLGAVLWWALGGSIDIAGVDVDEPAHYLDRGGCGDSLYLFSFIAGLLLSAVAAVKLIGTTVWRGR